MTATGHAQKREHRRSRATAASIELHLLRYIPARTPVHRLWAGTKLVAALSFSLALFIQPTWPAEAVLAGTLFGTVLLARIPRGSLPRLPRWLIAFVLTLNAVTALLAGGTPKVHIGGIVVGLGGLDLWARFFVLFLLVLLACYLVGWTTPLAELPPALLRLLAPLRLLRVPVEEIAIAVGLSIRCLPILAEEVRVLYAARRIRGAAVPQTVREAFREVVDLLVSALVVATRRAREMGDAIEARGGVGHAAHRGERPGWRDAVALGVVAIVVAAMIAA